VLQRFTLDRPWLVHGPGVHLAILTIIQGEQSSDRCFSQAGEP